MAGNIGDYDYDDRANQIQDLMDDAVNVAKETMLREAHVKFLPEEKKVEFRSRNASPIMDTAVTLAAQDYNAIATAWNKVKMMTKESLAFKFGTLVHQEHVPLRYEKKLQISIQVQRVDDDADYEYYLKVYSLDDQGFRVLVKPIFNNEPVVDKEMGTVTSKARGDFSAVRYVERGFRLWRNDTLGILWNGLWEEDDDDIEN